MPKVWRLSENYLFIISFYIFYYLIRTSASRSSASLRRLAFLPRFPLELASGAATGETSTGTEMGWLASEAAHPCCCRHRSCRACSVSELGKLHGNYNYAAGISQSPCATAVAVGTAHIPALRGSISLRCISCGT
jgi:hypothetical protein